MLQCRRPAAHAAALLLTAWTLALPSPASARKTPRTPCTGSFVVSGPPLAGDGSAVADILAIGTTIALSSGCPPVPVKLKATKKGTLVKAARWTSCSGLTGKAKLAGKIAPGCGSFSGVFTAKKSKVRRTVSAGRSSCGDGTHDVTSEACDGSSGCATGTTCRTDCTCSGANCTAGVPEAQFTRGGTLQAGQAVTFDGSASTDPAGDGLTWSWDFGDDRRGGGAQIAHVYATSGQRTVRLTVKDGCGNVASSEQALDVAAGPAPTATTMATGKIRDVTGSPLAGAQVEAIPGGNATSNASGDVVVSVGQGVPVRITVGKTGYAEQVILTEVPDLPDPDAYFEATLIAREPAQQLGDAAAGGAVAGKHGARVELPAGALVDDTGTPVSGPVDVSLTPIDVTTNIGAFPGRAVGLEPDGTDGPIVTYGVVEYAPELDGQPLNLAPGAQATIEIPIYAAKNLDGAAVNVGDTFPLWSLDPATAAWVQEGTGVVVQSAASPSGLALRGAVTHFSMWNCDTGVDPYFPKPRCLVDTNADGVLEDLTGTGHCWHGGTGPEQPDTFAAASGARPADEIAAYFPNWVGQEVLPAAGGVILPVPSDMDIVLHSRALGGLLQGSKMIRGAAFVEEDVIVELHEVNPTGNHITLPFEADRTISQDDSLHLYDFDGTAGQTVFVTVAEDGSSSTAADVFIILPDDTELGPVEYRPTVNRPGRIGLMLPTTGNYRITVNLVPLASTGSYHITVDYTANFPIVLSTTPAANATGVATSVTPSATFSQSISPFVSADLVEAEVHLPVTVDVTGAVATMTPAAPLIPGAGYRAIMDGFRSPGASTPDGFPRTHEWIFNVAEIAGTLVPIGTNRQGTAAVAADAAGNVYCVWQGYSFSTQNHETRAARYTPGAGWSPPLQFNEGAFVGPFYGSSVAAVPGGAVTVFPRPSGIHVSMVESRYTAATGWSQPQQIENVDGLFRDQPHLAADAQGNLIALFGTTGVSNDVYWSRHTAGGAWTTPEILIEDARTAHLAANADGAAIAIARHIGDNQALVRRFVPGVGWSAVEPFESDVEGFRGGVDDDGNLFLLLATFGQHVVRRFDVGTQTWSAPVNVQGSPTCAVNARLVVAADGHAIVSGCTGASPGPGIFATRYTPDAGGGTWAASELLASGASGIHDIGLDAGGNGVAIWTAAADTTMGHYKRFSTATGWEAPVHDFPAPTGIYDAHLAVGGNSVAVVVFDTFNLQRAFGVRLP